MVGRVVSTLDRLGPGEQTAVDRVNDRLSGYLSSTEEPSVQTLDGIFTTLDSVEFQVDIALGIGI